MPNENGRAYAFTALCPLLDASETDQSYAAVVKARLRNLSTHENSPFARVPNLYMCRLFVLDDVFYQGRPAREDHLASKYLVFVADIHGPRDAWLEDLWRQAETTVRELWSYCVGFAAVHTSYDFVRYLQKCQVETTLYFNGSNDDTLAEQLKALYVKQELGKFARAHQGQDAAQLQREFKQLIARIEPFNLTSPTWRAGASDPAEATVVGSEATREPHA